MTGGTEEESCGFLGVALERVAGFGAFYADTVSASVALFRRRRITAIACMNGHGAKGSGYTGHYPCTEHMIIASLQVAFYNAELRESARAGAQSHVSAAGCRLSRRTREAAAGRRLSRLQAELDP